MPLKNESVEETNNYSLEIRNTDDQFISEKFSKLKIKEDLPAFSCHQSQEELILVVKVSNLEKKNIRIEYEQPASTCSIVCSTKDEDLRDKNYVLYLKFLPECLVMPGKEMVTVGEMNAVIILNKDSDSHHHWEYFFYGLNAANAFYKEELTVSALQHKLDILQKEANKINENNEGFPDTKPLLTSISEDKVEIKFVDTEEEFFQESFSHEEANGVNCELTNSTEPSTTNHVVNGEAQDNQWPQNESGINGNHMNNNTSSVNLNRVTPFRRFRSASESNGSFPIKGILKQTRRRHRTMSESSDDLSWSSQDYPEIDSDIPEENNENVAKKSVHFNDNVFRSFFRSNSSILGQREKNRRKQRKKLEGQRRRRSSEGDSSGIEADDSSSSKEKNCSSVPALDINQNQAFICTDLWITDNQVVVDPQSPNVGMNDNNGKKSEKRKRKKKKGRTNNQNKNTNINNCNNSENCQFEDDILDNVPASSPASQYQRHYRYFSRRRHISV